VRFLRYMAAFSTNPPTELEIEQIADEAHELAGVTGCEIILAMVRKGQIHAYTTPKLSALVNESQGKTLLVKCLYDAHKLPLENIAQAAAKTAEAKADGNNTEEPVQTKPRSFEGIEFLRDEDARHLELTKRFGALRLRFLNATLPQNPNGEEGLLVVCTLSQQMLAMASPAFKPYLGSDGQRMIQTLLSVPTPNHVGAVLK